MTPRPRTLARLSLLAAAACGHPSQSWGARAALGWAEILAFKESHDYFALRDRLEAARQDSSPPARFGRALTRHAFNQPAASNAIIDDLLGRRSLPDSLVVDLRQLAMDNDLRLFRYRAGLDVADALLADTASLDSASLREARNTRRMFAALAVVPAQTVEIRGTSVVRFRQGRVPVTIGDSLRDYVFDTGANLSTIMRSEAEALGLSIHRAGIEVGTSTDRKVEADLGVADRVNIGAMTFHHVVFLVLEDRLLTFPGGFRIPGIIGFPVIEQMGEIRVSGNDSLVVPADPPPRDQRNLALTGLTMLTRASWDGDTLLCRVDTGADATQLYEPFYRRRRVRIDGLSQARTVRFGGAGGIREIPARRVRSVSLAVGDTTVGLDAVDVLTRSVVSNERANYLDCNLGHDVFDRFSAFVVSFRHMAFLLQ
jgi:Aspartyl protease